MDIDDFLNPIAIAITFGVYALFMIVMWKFGNWPRKPLIFISIVAPLFMHVVVVAQLGRD